MAFKKLFKAKLRDTPVSEYELDRLRHARESGKAKNPSWYKQSKLPAYREFIPNQPPVYPSWCKPTVITAAVLGIPFLYSQDEDLQGNAYVARFDEMNNLIPTPIIWVKPTHGNFA